MKKKGSILDNYDKEGYLLTSSFRRVVDVIAEAKAQQQKDELERDRAEIHNMTDRDRYTFEAQGNPTARLGRRKRNQRSGPNFRGWDKDGKTLED